MITYHQTEIDQLAVHYVGNKHNGEPLILSQNLVHLREQRLRDLLLPYFISPFKLPEYYGFTFSASDFTLNPLYQLITKIFDDPHQLHSLSVDIAKHLYDVSLHPQIKNGDLIVVYFSELNVDGETASAIGIFKSENKQPFVKLEHNDHEYNMQYEDGITTEKMDKGCIVFNLDKENGYKICIVDKSNKNAEAQYWKDDFLKVLIHNNPYHQTETFLNITKNYITDQYKQDFESGKTEEIDLLQRSMQYFKKNSNFDKDEFVEEVFHFEKVKDSFNKFDKEYRVQNDIAIEDQFDISNVAVKKQNKIFKSIIKLDKNFHIYVHGNREMMEKGEDETGRKFYKFYYYEET